MPIKRNVLIIIAIVLIAGFAYFKSAIIQFVGLDDIFGWGEEGVVTAREVSQVIRYEAPNGEDVVRFTLTIDTEGAITHVSSVNLADPSNEHLVAFSEELQTIIEGTKLSDLEPVDKIGTSSLTTAAFNDAIEGLKAQL